MGVSHDRGSKIGLGRYHLQPFQRSVLVDILCAYFNQAAEEKVKPKGCHAKLHSAPNLAEALLGWWHLCPPPIVTSAPESFSNILWRSRLHVHDPTQLRGIHLISFSGVRATTRRLRSRRSSSSLRIFRPLDITALIVSRFLTSYCYRRPSRSLLLLPHKLALYET